MNVSLYIFDIFYLDGFFYPFPLYTCVLCVFLSSLSYILTYTISISFFRLCYFIYLNCCRKWKTNFLKNMRWDSSVIRVLQPLSGLSHTSDEENVKGRENDGIKDKNPFNALLACLQILLCSQIHSSQSVDSFVRSYVNCTFTTLRSRKHLLLPLPFMVL